MIYSLHGGDNNLSREKLRSLLKSLFLKKPDAGFFKLDSDNFSEIKLEEFIKSQGLFEKKYIIQMDGLFEDKKISKSIVDRLEEIKESENIFIFIDKKIPKLVLKKIEKHAVKIQEFSLKKSNSRSFTTNKGDFEISDFNILELATYFGNRNKKDLWVLYQKTKLRDIPTEEVSGILFWQLKVMFQTLNSKNFTEAGLKPFVFNKAKGYLRNYSKEELKKMSSDLVSIYHEARRRGLEFDLALEKFILEL
ncbi:MAG: hypothetical protein U9P50_03155 [Patescibacteria group bacterium]|nr:hypothetical protein [Patescibacteria group bacterium]